MKDLERQRDARHFPHVDVSLIDIFDGAKIAYVAALTRKDAPASRQVVYGAEGAGPRTET
jgi:hypothetical protein